MANTVTFSVDLRGFRPWADGITDRARRASYRAGIDASKRMKAEGSRVIRAQKAMRVNAINKAIRIVGPTSPKDVHVWRVMAGIVAQPVMAFGPVRGKTGVRVEINKGSRTVIPHAFIATMKSGHTGVFMRYGQATKRPAISGYRGHNRYRGLKRQQIRELYTTRISDAFTDAIPAMAERGRTAYVQSFTRKMSTGASRSP